MVEMMKDARVCFKESQESMNFWDFLCDEKDYSKRSSSQEILTLKFEDEKGAELIQKCKALEAHLYDLVCSKPFFKSAKRWLFSDHFGTLNHLREELSNIYQCQFISLNVPQNETLDCVLIQGSRINRRPGGENTLSFPLVQDEETQSHPVIILCCPNAGYYEYMCYEGQWIDIYLKHGFQVFLWNYRGYGRSTGKPSPENLRRDGEEVVNYLREKLGVKTIGCHGESMGGLVATHLARWKNIDFLCADRTFESLFKVGSHVAGRFLAVLYRFITLWNDQVSTDYLEASCYKILTFDPRDEVIPFLCSLKHGVTMKVILNELEQENSEPSRPVEGGFFNIYLWLKKVVYAFAIERYYNKSLKKLENYNAGLSKDQVIALFRGFERIFELWDSYAAAQRKVNMGNRKGQISLSLPILPTMRPVAPIKPSAGDILECESNAPASPKRSSKNSLANEGSAQKIEMMQPSLVDQIDETPLKKKESSIDLKKSFARKSYLDLYNEEAQLDNQFTKFLGQVFSTLKSLEFAGVRISTILSVQEEHKLEAFEYFIKCLEVWGSRSPVYTPQHDILQNPNYYRTKGLNKIKSVTTRINQTIKMENLTRANISKLETLIIRDLELICEILNCLEKCVQESCGYYHKSQAYRRSMDRNSDIELAPINLESSKQPLLASTRTQFRSNADNYHYSTGHLIPLSCGHNGILEVFEVEIYEQFLKNSYLT